MSKWTKVLAALATLWVLGASVPASGQFLALDPRLDWQVLETEHFFIVYPTGLEAVAQETANYSEAAFDYWIQELGYTPPFKISEVIADIGDMAAGAANPLSHVTIQGTSDARAFNEWLNARARSGLEQVVFHELGHVVDLAKVKGVPAVLRGLFGAISMPQLVRPGSIIEGIPIYHEFARSGASRANDPREAMYLRALLLRDEFEAFDHLIHTGYSRQEFPSPYMLNHNYGAWFTRFLAERYGHEVIRNLDEASSESLLPIVSSYLLNDYGAALKQATGEAPQALYEGFQSWLSDQFKQQIERARGERESANQTISTLDYWNNEPAVSPDGKWVAYYHYDPARNGQLRLMRTDGSDDRMLAAVPLELPFFRPPYWAASPTWSPDGTRLAYHKHELVDRYYLMGDVYVYDLASGRETRLTHGQRAYKPTWLPDGRLLVARQREHALRTDLAVLDPASGEVNELFAAPEGMLIDDFAVSPDGAQIAISAWQAGFQDLYLLPVEGEQLKRLTQDRGSDTDPAWSPDGKYVLFSSDRDGINNLYALEAATGRLQRVSNVLTGAFAPQPTPDGQIVFVGYDTPGYDVRTMAYDVNAWAEFSLENEAPNPAPDFPEIAGSVSDYNAWRLMLPTLWVPLPGLGGQWGGLTFGGDPAGFHSYFLMGGYDQSTGGPFYALNYTNTQFEPTFTIDLNGTGSTHVQALSVDVPVITQMHADHTLNLGLRHTSQADQPNAYTATVGWRWNAIAHHDLFGTQRSVRVSNAWDWFQGDSALQRVLSLDWVETLRLPLEADHQLALRFAAGLSDSRFLRLGGDGAPYLLRGYAPGAFEGLGVWSASAEYRFPIVSVERGLLGLWSVFLDDIAGAVFADLGAAGQTLGAGDVHLGVGAELHTGWTLSYSGSLMLSLGAGYALDDGQLRLNLRLGTAF